MIYDDRLDRELDLWWDAEVLGDPHVPSTVALESEIEAIRNLHASDAPAAPTPAFAASLKVDLMMTARTMQAPARPKPARPFFKQTRPYDHPVSLPNAAPRRPRMAFVQFALVAVLLLGMIGAAYDSGVFDRFSNQPTPIPAVLGANAAATSSPAPTNATANYRGDASRSGQMPGPAPIGSLALAWQQRLPGVTTPPLSANGRLFITQEAQGGAAVRLYALDTKTGATLWKAPVASERGAVPALDDRYLYVLADQQTLVALQQDTGDVVWTYVAGETMLSVAPAAVNGVVFLRTDDQSVRAVDAATGQERWRTPIPSTTVNQSANDVTILSTVAIAVADDVVYAAGDGGILYALDAHDGTQRWTVQTTGNVIQALSSAHGKVYVIAQTVGPNQRPVVSTLYALNSSDGSNLWRINKVDPGVALAVGDDAVYISGSMHGSDQPANSLAAFDAGDGRKLWTAGLYNASAPSFVDGVIYVAAGGGPGTGPVNSEVYAIDAAAGSVLWKAAIGPRTTPLVVGGLIVVPTISSIVALDGDGSSATPAPGSEINVETNIANPQCSPPRTDIPTAVPSGTPTATVIHDRVQVVNGHPEILPGELPAGALADAGVVSGIEKTLSGMADCVALGGSSATQSLAGFATDNYLRRVDVRARSEAAGFPAVQPILGRDGYPVTKIESAVVLPDGRVGVAFMQTDSTGWYVVFAKQDGHWLIDEDYEIVRALGGKG